MALIMESSRNEFSRKSRDEWLIKNQADLETLPETVGPGSIAYTADLSFVAMMDEDGEWQAIKATEEETTTTTEETSGTSEETGGSGSDSGSGEETGGSGSDSGSGEETGGSGSGT